MDRQEGFARMAGRDGEGNDELRTTTQTDRQSERIVEKGG